LLTSPRELVRSSPTSARSNSTTNATAPTEFTWKALPTVWTCTALVLLGGTGEPSENWHDTPEQARIIDAVIGKPMALMSSLGISHRAGLANGFHSKFVFFSSVCKSPSLECIGLTRGLLPKSQHSPAASTEYCASRLRSCECKHAKAESGGSFLSRYHSGVLAHLFGLGPKQDLTARLDALAVPSSTRSMCMPGGARRPPSGSARMLKA
jgi:hypothetical protein